MLTMHYSRVVQCKTKTPHSIHNRVRSRRGRLRGYLLDCARYTPTRLTTIPYILNLPGPAQPFRDQYLSHGPTSGCAVVQYVPKLLIVIPHILSNPDGRAACRDGELVSLHCVVTSKSLWSLESIETPGSWICCVTLIIA